MAGVQAGRDIIISDFLCFTVNKFKRLAQKPLKSALLDFYNSEEISIAKDLLCAEIDKLELGAKNVRRRKDSNNRTPLELDDIFQALTYVDNAKRLADLPVFVSSDPDKMPSVKLTEGDLAVMMMKLTKLESNQIYIKNKVTELASGCRSGLPPTSAPIFKPSSFSAETGHHGLGQQASGASDAPRIEPGTSATSDAGDTSDNDAYQTQRRKKRRNTGASPSYANVAGSSGPPADIRRPGSNQQNKPKAKVLIGGSATSTLKASKTLIVKKAVFRLGNIDSEYATQDVEEYIRSLGVRLVSCFELPNSKNTPSDNKSFRVCIVHEDINLLCNSECWSVGISIREWIHKPKERNPLQQPTGASDSNNIESSQMIVDGACTNVKSVIIDTAVVN